MAGVRSACRARGSRSSSPPGRRTAGGSRSATIATDTINLYVYDFVTHEERKLTGGSENDVSAVWSPDGKSIAYVRGGNELHVVSADPKAKSDVVPSDRVVARAPLDRAPFLSDRAIVWSPDGKWIAYATRDGSKLFANAYMVSAAGGESHPVSFLSNTNADALAWSPDGTFLLLVSSQRTEPGVLARVDLVPRTPRFREDQFRDLFGPESPSPVTAAAHAAGSHACARARAARPRSRARATPRPSATALRLPPRTAPRAPRIRRIATPCATRRSCSKDCAHVSPSFRSASTSSTRPCHRTENPWPSPPSPPARPISISSRWTISRRRSRSRSSSPPRPVRKPACNGRRMERRSTTSSRAASPPSMSRNRSVRPVSVSAELDVDFAADRERALHSHVARAARQFLRREDERRRTGTRCATSTHRSRRVRKRPMS